MKPSTALAAVTSNITTNGRGEITGAVMRTVLNDIIALDDNAGAIKSPVRVATTANITLSGLQTVDGVALGEGDRVLVKDQTDGTENGIRAASAGAWARTIDFDAAATVLEGSFVWVMQGTTHAQTGWLQTAASPTIGTTALVFEQVAGDTGTPLEAYIVVCSDETSDLTTGDAKVTFRMPYAFTVTDVRASVTTAPTGSTLTVDINEGGVSILSTKITIDAGEYTSVTAATPPVISDPTLANDAQMTIDLDQVGSSVAGTGLKVSIIGRRIA